MDILEIVIAVICAFGIYNLLNMLRENILFPKKVRNKVRAAVIYDGEGLENVCSYVNFLRREQKISPERLIILSENDIIEQTDILSPFGDVVYIKDYKEVSDDTRFEDRSEGIRNDQRNG